MINMSDAEVAHLLDTWGRVSAASERAEADALVRECAGRLLADPGGETAYLWTFGLVAMSGYLAWRPGEEAEHEALEALAAVVRVLGDGACAHEAHPYEERMQLLREDEVWRVGPGPEILKGRAPEGEEAWLCPANLAGFARITADVIAPFTMDGIPELIPREHEDRSGDLTSVLNDHPGGDPGALLSDQAAMLPARPTKGVLAGYVLALHASIAYATSERITEPSVLGDMATGAERALRLLGDGGCAHADAEHPELDTDPSGNAATGYYLRSPGGRAEHRQWCDEDELAAWLCPGFLRGLAEEARVEFAVRRRELLGAAELDPS
ncbi:hypothetical protein ACZ90_69620 [Streptomyces albus subsp. albus]|nr:hypothetical protein ACZ90_69620 [Streptomyces albus subsp. albus]